MRKPRVIVAALVAAAWLATLAVPSVIATRAANRAVEQQQEESQRQAAASRTVFCDLTQRQADVYSDAVTEVGRNAAKAWRDMGAIYQCGTR